MNITLWLQQHNILLLLGVSVLLAGLLILRFRRRSPYWWGAWGGIVIVVIITLFMLRTSPMSISEQLPASIEPLEQYLTFVAAIEALVTTGDKPTLVEFYVDYGFN
ncbi:MAG: LPXTG cell wall anchor domain-containing protein [Caldilinea sp. CFX5]|nr:LPXTG cell wall anchor domain-containing protein [Caldilinea sp. CFX5]